MVDSQASAIVGNFFFNVGNTRCFVFKMEEVSKLGLLLFTFIFMYLHVDILGMREAKLVGCLSKDGSTSQSCLEATCCLLENSLATDSRESLEEDSYFANDSFMENSGHSSKFSSRDLFHKYLPVNYRRKNKDFIASENSFICAMGIFKVTFNLEIHIFETKLSEYWRLYVTSLQYM